MRVVGIIPSRMESKRLPNKPLKDICGLPLIIHVLMRCRLSQMLDEVYVATDSLNIKKTVEAYGGNVILTNSNHKTGTDRITEAANQINAEIVVNIQGDEALVNPEHIDKVTLSLIKNLKYDVAILVNQFKIKNSKSDIKVVVNKNNEILYMSRADIPFSINNKLNMLKAYHIVPFRKTFLNTFSNLPVGELEALESNEYLRIIENDFKILAVKVESNAISVDTEYDLKFIRQKMIDDKIFKIYKP